MGKPKGYIVGSTPGFASMAQDKLGTMGLARKLMVGCRHGSEFVQVDLEALSEVYEPELDRMVLRVKEREGLDIGIHLPVNMDLTVAEAFTWKSMQRDLTEGVKAASEKLKAKYVLFHTSSQPRPNVTAAIGQRSMAGKMVAPDGTNLADFIKTEGLKDWFMAKFIKVLFSSMGVAGDPDIITYFDDKASEGIFFEKAKKDAETEWRSVLNQHTEKFREFLLNTRQRELAELEKMARNNFNIPAIQQRMMEIGTDIQKINRMSAVQMLEDGVSGLGNAMRTILTEKELKKFRLTQQIESYTDRTNFHTVFDYWGKHGSEAEEQVAYRVIAKWMYTKKDKLWTSIVGTSKDPDKIIEKADREIGKSGKLIEDIKHLITAVAARYIKGHLFAKTEEYGIKIKTREKTRYENVYDYALKNDVHIYIETNMPPQGHEGELRVIKATDHIKIIKAIDGGKNLSYCLDFEHLLVNYVEPSDQIKEISNGEAKYITMLHINAPRPIAGAHAPVNLLSNDMKVLYTWMWGLRKKGMNNAYFIWEMGSYGIQQSMVAFRYLRTELLKDTNPNKLPKEFYGIDKNFEAAQDLAIREHALDPVKGLITVPEEEHTALSKAAMEKGKGPEWKKGRYR